MGFDFSDKPQPGYGFDYTEKEYHEELDKLLDVLGIKSSFLLSRTGFLVGYYGLTWALKNSGMISKVVILNSPVTASSRLGYFRYLFTANLPARMLGSPKASSKQAAHSYVLKSEEADLYRLRYLSRGGPGYGS